MGITPQQFAQLQTRLDGRRRTARPVVESAPRPAAHQIILGIDPSLRGTGYGVIRLARPHPQALAHGTVSCPASWEHSRCLVKIAATIRNANAFLTIQQEYGSFADYLWRFVDGHPKINAWSTLKAVPARTTESDAMSKDLLKRGFKFVGSTICYAFMQATGMVNDHVVECFRYTEDRTRPKSKI